MELNLGRMQEILKGCINNNRQSQRDLYDYYYKYGLTVASAYCNHQIEAREVLNDAFFQVFNKISDYDQTQNFEAWFRIIIIRTAINRYHKDQRQVVWEELNEDTNLISSEEDNDFDGLEAEDVLNLVNQLPPAYRMTLNLFAIEGYSHQEISAELGISIGTSKSNLSKARAKLKLLILKCKMLVF